MGNETPVATVVFNNKVLKIDVFGIPGKYMNYRVTKFLNNPVI